MATAGIEEEDSMVEDETKHPFSTMMMMNMEKWKMTIKNKKTMDSTKIIEESHNDKQERVDSESLSRMKMIGNKTIITFQMIRVQSWAESTSIVLNEVTLLSSTREMKSKRLI